MIGRCGTKSQTSRAGRVCTDADGLLEETIWNEDISCNQFEVQNKERYRARAGREQLTHENLESHIF